MTVVERELSKLITRRHLSAETRFGRTIIRKGAAVTKDTLFDIREQFIETYGFSILTEEVIRRLSKYEPFLEIGCGGGYWAYEFRQRKIDYIAYEPYPPSSGDNYYRASRDWTEIVIGFATDALLNTSPRRSLVIVWPCYEDLWSYAAVRRYSGPTIIYCGEWDGCTGSEQLQNELARKWQIVEEIQLPRWDAIYDDVTVFQRRSLPCHE